MRNRLVHSADFIPFLDCLFRFKGFYSVLTIFIPVFVVMVAYLL